MFLYRVKKGTGDLLKMNHLAGVLLALAVGLGPTVLLSASENKSLAHQSWDDAAAAAMDELFGLGDDELQHLFVVVGQKGDIADEEQRAEQLMSAEVASLLVASAAALPWTRSIPAFLGRAGALPLRNLVLSVAAATAVFSVWRISSQEDELWGDAQHTHSPDPLISKGGGPDPSQKPPPAPLMPPAYVAAESIDDDPAEHLHRLGEEAQTLEQDLNKAQREERLLDRLLQFRLKVYAYRKGITVEQIPPQIRSLMESELVTQHVNQLSDLSQERFMSLLEDYAEQDASLQNPTLSSQKANKMQRLRSLMKWVASSCGVGFVCLLFL